MELNARAVEFSSPILTEALRRIEEIRGELRSNANRHIRTFSSGRRGQLTIQRMYEGRLRDAFDCATDEIERLLGVVHPRIEVPPDAVERLLYGEEDE